MRIRLPALYPAQHAAIYHPARYVVIEASTKAGKTLGCLVWQMGRVIEDGGVHWWVAPVYAQARMAYERALGMLPRPIVASKSRSTLEIGLVNGARWAFRSGEQPDNLYGEDVRSAVIDEASRCRDEAWHAVRSTLTATKGPIRAIGNVRGRSNWHYRLARAAEAGEPVRENLQGVRTRGHEFANTVSVNVTRGEKTRRRKPHGLAGDPQGLQKTKPACSLVRLLVREYVRVAVDHAEEALGLFSEPIVREQR